MLKELNRFLGEPWMSPSSEITGITHDSRTVKLGDIYVAIRGVNHDGHSFVHAAMSNGAVAVIVDRKHERLLTENQLPGWVVEDTREVMGLVADIVFRHPTQKLHLVGVTGTNGKTSTSYLIAHLAKGLVGSSGVIGTLGAFANGVVIPTSRTTPESTDLQHILSKMCDQGAAAVAMEVASHALVHGRVNGCLFDAAVFTNLTQDHLDFHGNMESYFHAKSTLFNKHLEYSRQHGKRVFAVINIGSEWGRRLNKSLTNTSITTYAVSDLSDADMTAGNLCLQPSSTEFDLRYSGELYRVNVPLGGGFQVENALAALAWFTMAGGDIVAGIDQLKTCPQIPGRFEVVPCKHPFTVLVDYAHTPDGLENVLKTARELCAGRLLVVFGCGGDRDKTKRPQMGEIATRYSDAVFVTSDNPRTENPDQIIRDVVVGIPQGKQYSVITDRREAIAAAVRAAKENDVIVIAGKGHETYQIIGESIIPFDDRCVASEELSVCN